MAPLSHSGGQGRVEAPKLMKTRVVPTRNWRETHEGRGGEGGGGCWIKLKPIRFFSLVSLNLVPQLIVQPDDPLSKGSSWL